MKKAGIIGGLEFIGSYITLKFLSENYYVKVPVSRFNGSKVLYSSGLKANKYLEEFRGDINDLGQLRLFVSDCNVIIHCGSPYRVSKPGSSLQLFVPQIRGTGPLLKVLEDNHHIQKLFFISPPADLNSSFFPFPGQKHEELNTQISGRKKVNLHFHKAVFHAKRAQRHTFRVLAEKRVEVVFVSPAEVFDNTLFSSRETTSAGLKYLFENGSHHDPVFKSILQQNQLHTLVNSEDVAENVFSKVSSTVEMETERFSTVWKK